jgi:hypothetical protein
MINNDQIKTKQSQKRLNIQFNSIFTNKKWIKIK